MKVIWLIGVQTPSLEMFQKVFAQPHFANQYLVRSAESPDQIPKSHRGAHAVCVILDVLHPKYPGFEGLKYLRAQGFEGMIFLMGEPERSAAAEAFAKWKLTGFLPAYERLDVPHAVGLIHNGFSSKGEVDTTSFLGEGGRAGLNVVDSQKTFDLFSEKIGAFLGRFGISQQKFRKVLSGLSLAHVQEENRTIKIESAFKFFYGLDQRKITVGCVTLSRGINLDNILSEFTNALIGMHSQGAVQSMFPEFFHVIRETENLVIYAGHSGSVEESAEPLVIVASLPLPALAKQGLNMSACAFFRLKELRELSEELAHADLEKGEAEILPAQEEVVSPVPEAMAVEPQKIAPAEQRVGITTLSLDDVDNIIATPAPTTTPRPRPSSEKPETTLEPLIPKNVEKNTRVDDKKFSETETASAALETNAEIERLQDLCKQMGQDVKRLMKERREPTTDRELRDANKQLQEKLIKAQGEKSQLEKIITAKEEEFKNLKKQMEALRSEKEKAEDRVMELVKEKAKAESENKAA